MKSRVIVVYIIFACVMSSSVVQAKTPHWKRYLLKKGSEVLIEYSFQKLETYLSRRAMQTDTSHQFKQAATYVEPGEDWLVILGSYPVTGLDAAYQRARLLQENGQLAFVIDSNDYPNLTPDLYVVVMGPYQKKKALHIRQQTKTLVPDAYVKSGW